MQDVRDFYQKWYGVNNATLVLAGDFDAEQAKAWIEKYFGQFEPRTDVKPIGPMPVSLSHNKSLYHEDNFAKLPELTLTFPTVEQYSKDSYALELLGDLISDGKQSVLYKTIVEQDKLAPAVKTDAHHSELAGTFQIKVRAFNGTDLNSVKTSIDRALDDFAKNGFSDEQLERIKTLQETGYYKSINSVFRKAAVLAQHNVFAGDPNLLVDDIDRYRAVTHEQIMAVFKKYIYGKHYVATSFVPKGKVELALKGASKADVVEEKVVAGAEKAMAMKAAQQAKALPPLPEPPSSFDRSVEPPLGDKPQVHLPDVWQNSLDNGVKILGIEQHELPLVSFSIRVMGGHSLDKAGKEGMAQLMTKIMMEGTQDKTPQQLEQALGALGTELKFRASDEYITLSGNTLTANFPKVIALAQEILLKPRWDEQQWQRVKHETIARIEQSQASPAAIANRVVATMLYGKGNQLATPVMGSVDSVKGITLEDVKAFYRHNILAGMTSVHVAGDINSEQVAGTLQPFADGLRAGTIDLPGIRAAKPVKGARLYFVDVPGAKQSYINVGAYAMPANSEDYFPAVAVNHGLGGDLSSRLFQVMRLEKGYTYAAYSNVDRANGGGLFIATSAVRSNVTKESVQTMHDIIADYGNEFDQVLLDHTKAVMAKSAARNFETTDALISVLQHISSYGLPLDYVNHNMKVLEQMTLPRAKSILSKYFDPDAMVYVIVGDAKTQLEGLKSLGLGEPVLLDREGKPTSK